MKMAAPDLSDIIGKEVFVVYCWLKNSVTIIGISATKDGAQNLVKEYIDSAPDKEWEKVSGERRNNLIVASIVVRK